MVTIKNGIRLAAVFGEGRNCIKVIAGVRDFDGELSIAFMLPAGSRIPKVGTMGDLGGKMVKVMKVKQGQIDGMIEMIVEYCSI